MSLNTSAAVQRHVYALSELPCGQEGLAGGKGGTLARLSRAGHRVPPGIVILPGAFVDDDLTEEAWGRARGMLETLGGAERSGRGAFAVRSSALLEDSAEASYAGEFETLLGVREAELYEAICEVRRSRHGARVEAYDEARGQAGAPSAGQSAGLGAAEPSAHELAVVVQRLVRGELSGVVFTADPLTGERGRLAGSAVRGVGDALVGGEVDGESFSIDAAGRYEGPAALRKVARRLRRLGGRLEAELGGPQDVEWAAEGRALHVLQSRPISSLCTYRAATAEWNDSRGGHFLWSGTNLMEASPYALTPFSASLRRDVTLDGVALCEGSSVGMEGYRLMGLIGGRSYVNVTVQASAMLPLFGGDLRKVLAQVAPFWGEVPQGLEVPILPVSRWAAYTRVLPRLIKLGRILARHRKEAPGFVAETPRWCAEQRRRVAAEGEGAALARLWREVLRPYALRADFQNSAGASDLPVRVEQELAELVGADDAKALVSNLSGLGGQLASLGPAVGLERVARGELGRREYLEAYGHRGVNECECAWPRPAEDPAWMERQLAALGTPAEADPLARRREAFEAAWGRLEGRHPGKRRALRRKLEAAAEAARGREAVRSEATRVVSVLRAFALRAGELLGLGEEIFMLTADEVLALLEGATGADAARAHLAARRALHQRLSALPAYPPFILGRFDPFAWAADPGGQAARRADRFGASSGGSSPGEADAGEGGVEEIIVRGVAASMGSVEGLVRVLRSPDEAAALEPGEILVTPVTNIGWTLAFRRCAAVVTDVGAPLSHAAIVARELGLPAVVGCGDATARLRTGDRVRVDGGGGRVTLLGGR